MLNSFIIYLPRIDSSLENALETRGSLSKIGITANLFEGTYGNYAEELFLKQNRDVKFIEGVNLTTNKVLSPGVKGCFHSHYRLWEKCADLDEPIIIFEDDVVVLNKYTEIEFSEILILSLNYDWAISDKWKVYLEEHNALTTAQPYTSRFMPGASGYIIKPSCAKKLVKEYSKSYLPADIAINSDICEIQIHPQLIGRSKTMNEKESMTRSKIWNKFK